MKNQETNSYVLAEERTLLASERTFSAWLRTALAAMGGGIAILRLITFKTDIHKIMGHIIGEMLILWGCFLIVMASIDYKKVHDKLIIAKNYKSSQWGFLLMVVPLLIISILVIWITLP